MEPPEYALLEKVYWAIVGFADSLLRPMIRPKDYCCKLLCFRKAEWAIQSEITGNNYYTSYTEACARHVGHLLDDSPSFTVWPIEGQQEDN